mmetsp:Transcript_93829/g.148201  ORF Transcript_93829/g.148201 Transcript_93829/m.148201 type:complete len:203 (-) Transcript_93829:1436-2044(-)
MIHDLQMAQFMQKYRKLCATRDEICLRITLRWMHSNSQANRHKPAHLLCDFSIWLLFSKNKWFLVGYTSLLGLAMMLRKEIVPKSKVSADRNCDLRVQFMQCPHNFFSILEADLSSSFILHRAEREVQCVKGGVEVLLSLLVLLCHCRSQPSLRTHLQLLPTSLCLMPDDRETRCLCVVSTRRAPTLTSGSWHSWQRAANSI